MSTGDVDELGKPTRVALIVPAAAVGNATDPTASAPATAAKAVLAFTLLIMVRMIETSLKKLTLISLTGAERLKKSGENHIQALLYPTPNTKSRKIFVDNSPFRMTWRYLAAGNQLGLDPH
jgi:hypothetical protein